ncbi:MAG: hypothetical protein ACRDZ4_04645 [Egibacteraceae bacterium]
MAVTVDTSDPTRAVFTTSKVEWTIFREPVTEGANWVGPGYVARAKELLSGAGRWLMDDLTNGDSINDPRFGGLGCFGCHLGVAGQGKWDLTGRMRPELNGGWGVARARELGAPRIESGVGKYAVEVDLRDGWTDPLLVVGYDYTIRDTGLDCYVTVAQAAPAGPGAYFIKEPKLVACVSPHLTGPNFRRLTVWSRAGALLRTIDLTALPDPPVGTAQLPEDLRCRARWENSSRNPGQTFNVVAEAAPAAGGVGETWEGSLHGLDRWAQLANSRAQYSPSCAAYCLTGGLLKRKWEVASWTTDERSSCMFHAWEGGTGYPDCECALRAWAPNEGWVTCLSASLGAGWTV